MAYNLSNFTPGMKLTSEDLNKIDSQVLANLEAIRALQETNSIPSILQNNLRLVDDGTYIHLQFVWGPGQNDYHTLGTVPKGTDLSTFVGCTDFQVAAPPAVLYVGTPYTMQQTKQPSDCSQPTAWKVSDAAKAQITSGGVLTPRKAGSLTVTGQCASFIRSFAVTVKRTIDLSDKLVKVQGMTGDGNTNEFRNAGYRLDANASWGFSGFWDTDGDYNNNGYLDPGETITFTVADGTHAVRMLRFFQPAATDGYPASTGVLTETADSAKLLGTLTASYTETITNGSYSYTNETNGRLYFMFMLTGWNGTDASTLLPASGASWLQIDIVPAE